MWKFSEIDKIFYKRKNTQRFQKNRSRALKMPLNRLFAGISTPNSPKFQANLGDKIFKITKKHHFRILSKRLKILSTQASPDATKPYKTLLEPRKPPQKRFWGLKVLRDRLFSSIYSEILTRTTQITICVFLENWKVGFWSFTLLGWLTPQESVLTIAPID